MPMTAADYERFSKQAKAWVTDFGQLVGIIDAAAEAARLLETRGTQLTQIQSNVDSLAEKEARLQEQIAAARAAVEEAKQQAIKAIAEHQAREAIARGKAEEGEAAARKAWATATDKRRELDEVQAALDTARGQEVALRERIKRLQETLAQAQA